MSELFRQWMPILFAASALIVALAAMFEARGAKRSARARDHSIERLKESVARLQVDSTQATTRSSSVSPQPGDQHVEQKAQVTVEQQLADSTRVPVRADASVIVTADNPIVNQAQGANNAGPQEVTPSYSVERVQDLYKLWCTDRKRPRPTAKMEIASLQYDGPLESSDGRSRHRLKDAPQLAEFVRFSEPGSSVGVVLPDPDAHFTPVVAYLFPGLTRADYGQPSRLSDHAPVRIKRTTSSQWEIV